MRKLIVIASCFAPIAAVACGHTTAPQGASSASPSTPSDQAAPVVSSAAPTTAAPAASTTAPPAAADASGQLALPPASAKAWNNAQSDGKVPDADRGIDEYRAVIQANRDPFRACYEKSLSKNPDIKGRVTLSFRLGVDGKVLDAAIDPSASDISLPELDKCMADAVRALKFPPSKKGKESVVRYPFEFKPGSRR